MAIEKKWSVTGPYSVTAPGTARGILVLTSTLGLHVKQRIQLLDSIQPKLALEIKRVDGPTTIEVGAIGASLLDRVDVSLYGATSSVFAPEQDRPTIPPGEFSRALFEEEPAVAQRSILVDPAGNYFTKANPIPVQVDIADITLSANVTVVASALPAGAATSANQTSELGKLDTIHSDLVTIEGKQDTGNTSVASIDTKTPALVSGRVPVDGSSVTQPISAASLPLPSGAATESTLAAMSAKLPATLGTHATAASLAVNIASDQIVPVSGTFFQSTQPISAAALPLPTSAATAAKQDTGNTSVASIDTKTPALVSGRVPVDGSGVIQPVSAASLPLPAGASTEATLQTIATALILGQEPGFLSLPVVIASDQVVPVSFPGGVSTSGTVSANENFAWQTVVNTTYDNSAALRVYDHGAFQANNAFADIHLVFNPLNGNTVTIKTSDAATPYVITFTTGSSSPGFVHIGVDATATAISLAANISASAVSSFFIVSNPLAGFVRLTGTGSIAGMPGNGASVTFVSGQIRVENVDSTFHLTGGSSPLATESTVAGLLTNAQLRASAVPVSAASLPLPSGASTSAKQPALGTAGTASADVITVQGIASMTALKVDGSAVTQPVSGTFFQATQPISAASLPLPTGAATSALQTTGNTSLASLDTKLPSQGQAAMVASVPVVIASNQSGVPVTGTFFQATQPVSAASLPLPTGASTETTLAAASAKLPVTLGQKAMAASMAVVLASDQSSIPVTGTFFQVTQPVSAASLPLPSGASTSANQATEIASLASIDGKITSATTTITSVVSSATTVSLLASNAARKGFSLFNDSNKVAYVAFAATASTSAYTFQMLALAYYERQLPNYTGAISALWASANGNMRITEMT